MINQREKDLKGCIGIARMLLDTNENLDAKLKLGEKEIKTLQSKISSQESELINVSQNLEITEEKYKEVKNALARTEGESYRNTVDLLRVSEDSQRSKNNENLISLDRYDADINELTEKFRSEYEFVLSKL